MRSVRQPLQVWLGSTYPKWLSHTFSPCWRSVSWWPLEYLLSPATRTYFGLGRHRSHWSSCGPDGLCFGRLLGGVAQEFNIPSTPSRCVTNNWLSAVVGWNCLMPRSQGATSRWYGKTRLPNNAFERPVRPPRLARGQRGRYFAPATRLQARQPAAQCER